MNISQEIEAVYRRALLLRQYATESPVQPDLLEKALQDLYLVLEELQTSQEELRQQNQELTLTRRAADIERQCYESLFELAPTGYLVTGLQGSILQVNRYAAEHLFYIPQEFLINKPLVVLLHEPDRPLFQSRLSTLSFSKPWEACLNPRNSTLISISIAVTRIKYAQQQREMLLWSLHDITLRKQMEQQLQTNYNAFEARVEERIADLVLANLQLQQELAAYQADKTDTPYPKVRIQASLETLPPEE